VGGIPEWGLFHDLEERAAMFTRMLVVSLSAAVGLTSLAGEPSGASEAARASKLDLTPERLPEVLALVRPHESEWRHLKVRWLTDIVAARRRAAAEDKPIVICYTGGAGYNEPLGVC
jgi:hypothetical protein